MERATSVRLAGPVDLLVRPLWGLIGAWAVACGALAASEGVPAGKDLPMLLFALLLANLGWGAAWQLAADTDWFHPMTRGWPPQRAARLPMPPYTQPDSPAGRLWGGAGRLAGWWRDVFWPVAGAALAGLVTAAVLAIVFGALLYAAGDGPARAGVRLLSAAAVALIGIGVAWRRRGWAWHAGRAAVLVALPWLVGHLALAPLSAASAVAALAFAAAAWGIERVGHGLRGGPWLIDGAQALVVALLVVARQPLAAGALGALLLGQVALQPAAAADPAAAARRMRPWLLAAMLLVAVALQ